MANLNKRTLFGGLSLTVVSLTVALSGCGPTQVATAPPPPQAVVIPPRPTPPMGAAPNMMIPAAAADGSRVTVNSGVSTAQQVWNLRSAYNVAALNCVGPQYAPILAGYKQFLTRHAKSLTATNKALDVEFRKRYGAKAVKQREAYQTSVYNFFALPPVTPALCSAALSLATDLEAVPAGKLDGFAPTGLAKAEAPFREFFNSYDQYRADLAAWETRYGTTAQAPAVPVATSNGAAQVASATYQR